MMAKLDFAFWDPIMGPIQDSKASADVFDEHIRLAQRIEELGWHSYFTIEHQNNPGNLASSPSVYLCLLYTSPSPRDGLLSRMPSSA